MIVFLTDELLHDIKLIVINSYFKQNDEISLRFLTERLIITNDEIRKYLHTLGLGIYFGYIYR
jgi:hypothetical protein